MLSIPSLVAVVVLSALTIYVLVRRPPPPLWLSTLAVLGAALVFSLGKFLTYLTVDPALYWIATAFSYSGLMFVGTMNWALAHRFAEACGRPFAWSSNFWIYLPSALVVPVWLGMMTNPLHGQFMTLHMTGPHEHHWIWFLQAGTSYLFSLLSFGLYAQLILRVQSKNQRRRIFVMLIAPAVTLGANFLHLQPETRFPFDPTATALAITATLFLIGIYKVGIFSLNSVALSSILDSQPHGIAVTDSEGYLLYFNEAAAAALRVPLTTVHTHFDDWLQQRLRFEDAEALPTLAGFLEQIESLPVNARMPRFALRETPEHWLQIRVDSIFSRRNRKIGSSYFIQDISKLVRDEAERVKIEQKMIQAQKLEGIGLIAGGIAHDFNNLLMAICGNAELLALQLQGDAQSLAKVQAILGVSERGAKLVQQLLASSGEKPVELVRLNVSALVRETADLLSAVLTAKKMSLSLELDEDCWTTGDQSVLVQVIMNLTINAAEAYGNEAGSIVIRTRASALPADAQSLWLLNPQQTEADFVSLEMQDFGSGMDREFAMKIADPFFSSKGQSRGLGLSAVLGIVRGHGGAIYVQSAPDQGSRFLVLLPRAGDLSVSEALR